MLASPLIFSIAIRLANREYRKFDYNTLLVTILFYVLYFGSNIFYLPFSQLDQIALEYPILKFLAFVLGCFSAIILVLVVVKICFRMVKIGLLQVLLAVLLSFMCISALTLIYNGNTHDAIANFWNLILFYQTCMTIVIVSALRSDMDSGLN